MRKHYIDNLRWITILLLVPYHAAMAWNVWNEPTYIYFNGSKVISSIVVFLSPYFMPLLFLLAGISTRFALQKRSVRQYLGERSRKLLLPFLCGTLFLMPVMTYFADKFNNGYDGRFYRHYGVFFTKFTDLTGADGGFSIGQFWFVLYLFLISVLAVGVIALQKKVLPEHKNDLSLLVLCALGLPLPLCSELLSIGGKSLVEYAYIFLVGYYVFANDNTVEKTEKYKRLFLLIGLTASVLNVYLFIWSDVQIPLLNMIAKYVSEWFMMLTLIGFGKRYLNGSGKLSAYMTRRSFPFYSFHFIWVVLFQYSLYGCLGSNTFLLYALPVILSYCATFLCCELCIRIPFLRFSCGLL